MQVNYNLQPIIPAKVYAAKSHGGCSCIILKEVVRTDKTKQYLPLSYLNDNSVIFVHCQESFNLLNKIYLGLSACQNCCMFKVMSSNCLDFMLPC
jgi:hypothetical protein